MQLYYQSYSKKLSSPLEELAENENKLGEVHNKPPVVIIPGLFGSTVNWRSFAKKLSESHDVIVIDQRNHGESPHASSHSYADMVSDLLEFIDRFGLERIVLCGHSMGGKVAMLFSLLYPERVSQLVVLDIAPVTYKHSHAPYLRALMKIDLSTLSSRSDAEKALKESIPDTSTRLFLIQSLVGKQGEYYWRLNLPVLLADMPLITGFPKDNVDGISNPVDTLFVLGGESDYVRNEDVDIIKAYFPNTHIKTIDGAGHWLHAERPQQVMDALTVFIKK